MKSRQRGQALVEAMIATVVMVAIVATSAWLWQRHRFQSRAQEYGQALAQFAVGLQGFVADVQNGDFTLPSNPYTAPQGVDWLKPPSCGGLAGNPATGYIPCAFQSSVGEAEFFTRVTLNPVTRAVEVRTHTRIWGGDFGHKKRTLFAAAIAQAARAQQALHANGMFFTVMANVRPNENATVSVGSITPGRRGWVTIIVNNAPSNDIWLRTDGTNKMRGNLDMGGHSVRSARHGDFSGDVRIQGVAQVDGGLNVTNGTLEAKDGILTKDVQIQSRNRMLGQGVYDMRILTGSTSYTVPVPNCGMVNGGASNPAIFTSIQSSGSPATSRYDALYDSGVTVVRSGSTWRVTPYVHAAKFTIDSSGGRNPTTGVVDISVALKKQVAAMDARKVAVVVATKCQ